MRPAITGANGFIGRHICQHLVTCGEQPIILARKRPSDAWLSSCHYLPYSIEHGLELPLPDDCDSVIHCAYRMGLDSPADHQANVAAALKLKNLCQQERSRRFIFVSSMSAHSNAESHYGRSKWEIERQLHLDDDLVIKPGFVVGNGGLFYRIRRSLHILPIVPLFYGGNQPIHPIWIGDLAGAIVASVQSGLSGTLPLGSISSIPLRQFYRQVLQADGIHRPLVALPGGLSLLFLRAMEAMGVRLPVTTENLLGLRALRSFDTETSLKSLGISLRPLSEALRLTPFAKS